MAHSAYPELGRVGDRQAGGGLASIARDEAAGNPEIGPCTLNIGLIEGGRAPNVIPDHASAQLLYRLVGPSEELRRANRASCGRSGDASISRWKFRSSSCARVEGMPTMVAAFTTDIPALTQLGRAVLLGPGSIHVAHTDGEFMEKQQLTDAVDLYAVADSYGALMPADSRRALVNCDI